jgi:hypothetical protein
MLRIAFAERKILVLSISPSRIGPFALKTDYVTGSGLKL